MKRVSIALLALTLTAARGLAGEVVEIPEVGGTAAVPDGWSDLRRLSDAAETRTATYRTARDPRSPDAGMIRLLVSPQDPGVDPDAALEKYHDRLLKSFGGLYDIAHRGSTTLMGMPARYIIGESHRATDGKLMRIVSVLAMDDRHIIAIVGACSAESWEPTWTGVRGVVTSMRRK